MKLKGIKAPKNSSMKYVEWYALLLVFCCFIYIIGWLIKWYISGIPDLVEFRAFIHEIASNNWVVIIGFVCTYLIDKDKDGIPDIAEKSTSTSQQSMSPQSSMFHPTLPPSATMLQSTIQQNIINSNNK
jgi:hypothetical protein